MVVFWCNLFIDIHIDPLFIDNFITKERNSKLMTKGVESHDKMQLKTGYSYYSTPMC